MVSTKHLERHDLVVSSHLSPSHFLSGETSKVATYKQCIATFYFNYASLVLNSFGLQNALERVPTNIGHFFSKVHSSAMACALLVRDRLGPSGYMRYSPDSHFVQSSYAVLSLLKVLSPYQIDLECLVLTLVACSAGIPNVP